MRFLCAFLLAVAVAGLTASRLPAAADDPTPKAKLKAEMRKKLAAKKAGGDDPATTTAAKPKPTPRPTKVVDAAGLAALIDRHLDAKLAAAKVTPAPAADDSEFLRRAYLDLTGVIPPADEARRFLDDKDPAKPGQADRRPAGVRGLRPAAGRRVEGAAHPDRLGHPVRGPPAVRRLGWSRASTATSRGTSSPARW